MRRVRKDYVNVRVKQLEEDREKASKDYDKEWYNRIINELRWAESMLLGEQTDNCNLDRRT